MEHVKGNCVPLSPARRMAIELLRHAACVPTVPVARTMNLARLSQARERLAARPSWTALFIRAYGLVSQRFPELRRVYIPWPYPHLYEHPHSVCALVVEREWEGEAILLGAKLRAPETMAIDSLHRSIRRYKESPLLEIGDFRQALRVGRLPGLLRRFVFWQTLYLSGFKRAKRFGTFMVSSYGSLGAEQIHPLAPFTTLLTFGPLNAVGEMVVKVIYDHRVMDGRTVARALLALEETCHAEVLEELLRWHALPGQPLHPIGLLS